MEKQNWYFTFGGGHEHRDGYVKIYGTHSEAREEMVRRYGLKWAFQYPESDYDEAIKTYNLYEVKE